MRKRRISFIGDNRVKPFSADIMSSKGGKVTEIKLKDKCMQDDVYGSMCAHKFYSCQSDDGQEERSAEKNKSLFLTTIWKIGCILYNLLQINLEDYPEGNVITKRSVQKRRLSGGHLHEYVYYYNNVDIFGIGQFHLPVKNKGERRNPDDKRWKLHDKVMYRQQISNRISSNFELLENAIKQYNSLKKCFEAPKNIESVMKDVECAMQNKTEVELKQIEISNYGYLKKYENDNLIITELGEKVRSKNECIFANLLNEMHVPYLYEARYQNKLLPDFTIFINDKIYYIEILGKMNEVEYENRQHEKIDEYSKAGLNMGEQLICVDVTLGIDLIRLKELVTALISNNPPNGIYCGCRGQAVS